MNDSIDLRRILDVLVRRWWIILLATAVAVSLGLAASRLTPRVYQGSTILSVGESIRTSSPDRGKIEASQLLAQTYADIARRQPVLQGAIDVLGLNEDWMALRRRVRADLISSTQLLEIVVEAGTPDAAQAIAGEIAQQLIRLSTTTDLQPEQIAQREFVTGRIATLQERIRSGQLQLQTLQADLASVVIVSQQQAIQAEIDNLERLLVDWQSSYNQLLVIEDSLRPSQQLAIIEPAHADPNPVRPRTTLNMLLAGMVGLLLAIGGVFVAENGADTIRSAQDVDLSLGLPLLGAIGRVDDRLLTSPKPSLEIVEDNRIVRNAIQFVSESQPAQVLMITSPADGEGKTTTAANLAVTMAQVGLRTVVVDADLRRPALHKAFHLPNDHGLANLLAAPGADVNGSLRETGFYGLRVLTSGPASSRQAEWLGTDRMQRVVKRLRETADVVIVDTPPVLAVADATAMARHVDGVVLVFHAGRTRRAMAWQAMTVLQRMGATLLGGVLNRVSSTRAGYGYGYGRAESPDANSRRSRLNPRNWGMRHASR